MTPSAVERRIRAGATRHPFPAALDDCATAYRWLLSQGIAPQNTVLAGDSAGGNLTLTTMMKLAAAASRPASPCGWRRTPHVARVPALPGAAAGWRSAGRHCQGLPQLLTFLVRPFTLSSSST